MLMVAIFKANLGRLLYGVLWYIILLFSRLAVPFIVQEIVGWVVSEEKDSTGLFSTC